MASATRERNLICGIIVTTLVMIGCGSDEMTAGTIDGAARSTGSIATQTRDREIAARDIGAQRGKGAPRQILFGDLHVHSTYSVDAFMYSLPIFAGEGAHPPADACDFARHCAGLDFFSINDHAEGLTPDLWRRTKESIRACNEVAGDPADPDLVAFVGWEWTQTGTTPETHYGHKNVVFPELDDDKLPARAISAVPVGDQRVPPRWVMKGGASLVRAFGYPEYGDVISFMADIAASGDCERGIPTRELPADCRETADTPRELFRKLDEWGFESLVIPHGLAWGIHAPPGGRLDVQLAPGQHDPEKQRLIEISSGHGNSEEYRSHAEYEVDASGDRICPQPTSDYLPCCWQAGVITRSRCSDPLAAVCEVGVMAARQAALDAGVDPHQTIPGTTAEDWLDCDQCRDCFKPAMNLRPGMTAQYGAAISSFTESTSSDVTRFRWGFIASTDNHAARPATGYKQYDRRIMTDSRGFTSAESAERVRSWTERDPRTAENKQKAQLSRLAQLFDSERETSFLYPGGIVAAHATGRDRRSIWDALMRREVYGTSGPRILLWFDLVNPPTAPTASNGYARVVPMGGEVEIASAPRFEVRAVGSHHQNPGCPQQSISALSPERLFDLCRDECYFPAEERHLISRIEVVRIRPQERSGEPIAPLIEDPWLGFDCPPDPGGCVFSFSDPDYPGSGRDAVYYVRALQESTPAINGANLRTEFDAAGRATRVTPCFGGYRTPESDDCLAPAHERAWSSPIYVDQPVGSRATH